MPSDKGKTILASYPPFLKWNFLMKSCRIRKLTTQTSILPSLKGSSVMRGSLCIKTNQYVWYFRWTKVSKYADPSPSRALLISHSRLALYYMVRSCGTKNSDSLPPKTFSCIKARAYQTAIFSTRCRHCTPCSRGVSDNPATTTTFWSSVFHCSTPINTN